MKETKTIFDNTTREELISRVNKISDTNKAEWGKMNIFQMLRHNTYWNTWILGRGSFPYKQDFLGKVFGKIALKKMIRDDEPFDKNIPTSGQFKFKELTGDVETEKADWVSLIREYDNYNNPDFVHDFFGKMRREEIGILAYKHTDHHLRQFGA